MALFHSFQIGYTKDFAPLGTTPLSQFYTRLTVSHSQPLQISPAKENSHTEPLTTQQPPQQALCHSLYLVLFFSKFLRMRCLSWNLLLFVSSSMIQTNFFFWSYHPKQKKIQIHENINKNAKQHSFSPFWAAASKQPIAMLFIMEKFYFPYLTDS